MMVEWVGMGHWADAGPLLAEKNRGHWNDE